jgi:putative sporulation protein YyaC
MLIAQAHYSDQEAKKNLIEGFQSVAGMRGEPLFYCIGSDRHILDCFGPLVGSMLRSAIPDLDVFGTLDEPLHAKNLVKEINYIKSQYPGRTEVAIDASLGGANEIGIIKLKDESLLPGKAIFKRLPAVGHFSLVGIVESRGHQNRVRAINSGSLTHVYHMAALLCSAIREWYNNNYFYR